MQNGTKLENVKYFEISYMEFANDHYKKKSCQSQRR